jgi:predicted nuclease of predicted toxin-antitoxin system
MIILIDMNLSPEWASLFKAEGFQAFHWSELGSGNAPDTELFDWARTQGATLFTHDLDFGAMLALTGMESPSVFQIRTYDVTPRVLGTRALGLLRLFEKELNDGALIVVDEFHERVRLLPLIR